MPQVGRFRKSGKFSTHLCFTRPPFAPPTFPSTVFCVFGCIFYLYYCVVPYTEFEAHCQKKMSIRKFPRIPKSDKMRLSCNSVSNIQQIITVASGETYPLKLYKWIKHLKNVISDDWETWERISQKLIFWRHGIQARWCSWDSIGLFMVLAPDWYHSTSAQSFW